MPLIKGEGGTGGGSAIVEVANYSALPAANTVPGILYAVLNDQGTKWLPGSWGGTFYQKGLYYSDGSSWIYTETPYNATLATVDTGTNDDQFVTSYTLKNTKRWDIHTSGLTSGGVVTINADPAKIDITAGTGTIVDYWTTPGTLVRYEVTWASQLAVVLTNIATSTLTYLGIDKTGTLIQYNTEPTNTQRRDIILIAQIGHANLTTIGSINSFTSAFDSPQEGVRDILSELHLVNTGNKIIANGANLKIDKSNGYLFGLGLNYNSDIRNPNKKNTPALVAASFRYRTQTGGSTGLVSDISPTNYDLAGVVTAIGGSNNQATNQRVYLFPNNNIVIQYGQTIYSSISNAIQGVQSETFVEFTNPQQAAILIAIISITKGCTSLQNTTDCRILYTTRFGENIGGASGISVTSLQSAYNNSVEPEILTDSTRGAVAFRRGSAADTDTIIEGQNGAGTVTFSVTGNGLITGTTTTQPTNDNSLKLASTAYVKQEIDNNASVSNRLFNYYNSI